VWDFRAVTNLFPVACESHWLRCERRYEVALSWAGIDQRGLHALAATAPVGRLAAIEVENISCGESFVKRPDRRWQKSSERGVNRQSDSLRPYKHASFKVRGVDRLGRAPSIVDVQVR